MASQVLKLKWRKWEQFCCPENDNELIRAWVEFRENLLRSKIYENNYLFIIIYF